MTALTVTYLPIEQLVPYARNSRTHSDAQIAQIAGSIREFGWSNPVLTDGDGGIIAGHGRVLAARQLGMQAVPCIRLGHLSPTQRKALIIADNKLALNAGWDDDALKLELEELQTDGFSLDLTGFSGEEIADLLAPAPEDGAGSGDGSGTGSGAGSLAERFGVPPFSVLNAREGWWQDRKRAWIGIGIQSELGRGAPCLPADAQDGGNGFLIDQMRRSRKANAVPGGAPMPIDRAKGAR